MGGTVAFELARQLFGERKDAGFIAFFGVPYPTFFSRFSMFAHKLEIRARLWRERARLLARQSVRERLAYLKWRANLHKQPPDPVWVARVRVETATLQAVREYVPRPFRGQVHHFMPCRSWVRPRVQTERWYSLASAIETWFGPEGCTADDMLLPQYAPGFAEQFRQSCARTWS
jgi:hypothetical protein